MPTIVLVDDYELLTRALDQLLSHELDFDVVAIALTAESGLEAVERLQPDVAVVDYWLTDGDGLTLTKQIKLASPATSVIMLTGMDDPSLPDRARDAGCEVVLSKVAAAGHLADAIRQVMSTRGCLTEVDPARVSQPTT